MYWEVVWAYRLMYWGCAIQMFSLTLCHILFNSMHTLPGAVKNVKLESGLYRITNTCNHPIATRKTTVYICTCTITMQYTLPQCKQPSIIVMITVKHMSLSQFFSAQVLFRELSPQVHIIVYCKSMFFIIYYPVCSMHSMLTWLHVFGPIRYRYVVKKWLFGVYMLENKRNLLFVLWVQMPKKKLSMHVWQFIWTIYLFN